MWEHKQGAWTQNTGSSAQRQARASLKLWEPAGSQPPRAGVTLSLPLPAPGEVLHGAWSKERWNYMSLYALKDTERSFWPPGSSLADVSEEDRVLFPALYLATPGIGMSWAPALSGGRSIRSQWETVVPGG